MRLVKSYPFISFVILSYLLTWGIGIPMTLLEPSSIPPNPFDISQIGAIGPAVASLVVIYVNAGKDGLRSFIRQLTKWRIGAIWYLVILLVPLIWSGFLPSIVIHLMQYKSLPPLAGPSYGAPSWKYAGWFLLYILIIGGGQEEIGWRGYLLPHLQLKHNAVISSLVTGIIWSFWHLPFFFIPGSSLLGTPFVGYLIQLTLISFVLTWLYNNTESILACILYHTWMNFTGAYLQVGSYTSLSALATLVCQLGILIVIISVYGPKSFRRDRHIHTQNLDESPLAPKIE
jgi:membrane protease YdiL (CAAX protease family)